MQCELLGLLEVTARFSAEQANEPKLLNASKTKAGPTPSFLSSLCEAQSIASLAACECLLDSLQQKICPADLIYHLV
jgi:hypothetical protein